jgi:hypothetical protein
MGKQVVTAMTKYQQGGTFLIKQFRQPLYSSSRNFTWNAGIYYFPSDQG